MPAANTKNAKSGRAKTPASSSSFSPPLVLSFSETSSSAGRSLPPVFRGISLSHVADGRNVVVMAAPAIGIVIDEYVTPSGPTVSVWPLTTVVLRSMSGASVITSPSMITVEGYISVIVAPPTTSKLVIPALAAGPPRVVPCTVMPNGPREMVSPSTTTELSVMPTPYV
jgi:hypothetical protein